MNIVVLLYSIAYWLKSNPVLWVMVLCLFCCSLGLLVFLIVGHRVFKLTEKVQEREQPIPERRSYRLGTQTSTYYYAVLASLAVLVVGLISSIWFTWETEMNKSVTSGCGASVKPNVKTSQGAMVYTYRTESALRAVTGWHAAPNLSFTIDSGNGTIPTTLAWTDQQGNATSISFQADMCKFFGNFQRPNEAPVAYQGTLLSRRPLTQQIQNLGEAQRYTYQTENAWGDITEWHAAPNLSFAIDSGNGVALSTLKWTDQQGNAASISFQTDMSTFFGYFQKPNEGPIAYQGTLLAENVKSDITSILKKLS